MTEIRYSRGAYTASPCRACRAPKPVRLYLCGNCWGQLPAPAQRALKRSGDRGAALRRLRELQQQIDDGRALSEIEVTP